MYNQQPNSIKIEEQSTMMTNPGFNKTMATDFDRDTSYGDMNAQHRATQEMNKKYH